MVINKNMKYLKLFESYKETTDSINLLMNKFESDKDEIINQYKELIDDLLLDISDDYICEFISKYEYLRKVELDDNFLRYRISFPIQNIDDFFEKLEDVLDRIVDTDIDYTIDSVNTYEELFQGRIMTSHISAKQRYERHPHCISTSKSEILKGHKSKNLKYYCLYISF